MTAFNWDPNEFQRKRDKYGMLSASSDLLSFSIILDTMTELNHILELGTYIGGSLLFMNDVLIHKGINAKFTVVDDINWAKRFNKFVWHHHALKSLAYTDKETIETIIDSTSAEKWLNKRCLNVTGKPINLRWFLNENDLDNQQYNLIFHDYGNTKEENTATINLCLPKLTETGIYVIDDFESAQPYRVLSTVEAMQQGKLFPVLWGERKVYFAKTIDYAQEFIKMLLANPNLDLTRFTPYANYTYLDVKYTPLKLNSSPLSAVLNPN